MKEVVAALFLVGVISTSSQTSATTIICPESVANKYGYGVKGEMWIAVGKGDPDRFTSVFQDYANRTGWTYGGAGSTIPGVGGKKTLTHILQNESYDIAIEIHTDSTRDAARVDISTYSYRCEAVEDWRPSWRKFKAFLKEKHFKRLPAKYSSSR